MTASLPQPGYRACNARQTFDVLQRDIVTADPERAQARAVLLAAAWSDLLEKTP